MGTNCLTCGFKRLSLGVTKIGVLVRPAMESAPRSTLSTIRDAPRRAVDSWAAI